MFDGWDVVIIGAIAIVVLMWGPSKIPEFAKALGKAKGEFQRAQDEFSKAANESTSLQSTSNVTVSPSPPPSLRSKDEVLLGTARNLGISTEGKTREEISEEISVKAKLLSAD